MFIALAMSGIGFMLAEATKNMVNAFRSNISFGQ
jgi:hypothetical protein